MNFQVETHNFCNMTCGYCPNKDMGRKRQFMSDEVWNAILNLYIVPYRHVNAHCPPTAILHKDGEPLIDRKLPSRLRSLPADMTIDIYSNGVLLPKWRERGEDFIDFLGTLPMRVRYMMSYHPYNHDGSANDYAEVVLYLREKLQNPPHNVEFISTSHKSKWVSEAQQIGWRNVWRGFPITVHCNTSINPWTGRIEEGTVKFDGCPYGDFSHWFFGCSGNVIACCMDLEEEIVLGNVLEHSPADMFTRTADFYAEQRRAREARERPLYAVCDDCFGYRRADRVELGTGAIGG